jgi:HAD superfamily hydrolase (TIGR01549 family)
MSQNFSKVKTVIFDADNTLYNTKSVAKNADLAAMAVLGYAINKKPEDLYQEFLAIVEIHKKSADPKVRHRKYSYGSLCAKYETDKINEMYRAFEQTVLDKIEIIPGVIDLLNKLAGRELFVVTEDNRDMALKKLAKLNIEGRFSGVVTSDDAGVMKPSENYYTAALSKFKPEDILVIGDNYEKDLALPAELGMQIFLVDSPEKIRELLKTI